MSNIYNEAIADAKKLKEIAEQNATNKVIESIAPKIRQLIEQEINAGLEDELDFGLDDEIDSESMPESTPAPDLMVEPMDVDLAPPAPDSVVPPAADLAIADDEPEDEKNVTVNITVESRKARRVRILRQKAVDLVLELKSSKSPKQQRKILSELKKLKSLLVSTNEAEQKLGNEINEVLKESKMSKTTRRTTRLNKNAWWLFEGDEDIDLGADEGGEAEDLEMDDEGGDEEVDVPAIESAVEDLAGALGLEIVEEEGEGDEADEEGGEEELDLDLGEADHDEASYKEAHHDEASMKMEVDADEADMDEMIEISESALRREINRMKRKTTRSSRRMSETRRRRMNRRRRLAELGDPVAAMHDFEEEVIDVSKEDLVNALAEELGTDPSEDLTVDGMGDAASQADAFGGGSVDRGVVPESRRRRRAARRSRRASTIRESKNQKALLQARKAAAAAKRELQESNLFNAKLLYVNKLMQQHDLNSKQQRAIVEALDNAKTHREAKLLYTSLTESLRRRKGSRSAGSLNEGLVRGGSSSNPTKSAAPANNGSGLDRWATLAGIKK